MALAPGTQLGQYTVVAAIGAGGMGEVYRARDRALGRDVAIKALPVRLAAEPDRLARLRHEARMLARLNHRSVAAIYGLEESSGALYLVLELVEGETLGERLSRAGPMTMRETLKVAIQIADALEAAHAKGIIHRDIKPANIKLTHEGRVKVLDFGIAKSAIQRDIQDDVATRTVANTLLTEPGGIVGTPAYMSPEQVRGDIADPRSDVWAFGCVVYELLSGKRAFPGAVIPDVFAAVLRGEPEWGALPADAPAKLTSLLRKCMEKDAATRWQAFGDVRRELASIMSALPEHEHAGRHVMMLLGAAPVVVITLLASARPDVLATLDYAAYDTVLRWTPTSPPDPRVAIVEIDDRSLAAIGQWPWRRDVIGRLVERLRALGASAISLEMFFPEPDRFQESPRSDGGTGTPPPATPDMLFAEALRGGKVIVGHAMSSEPGAATDQCVLHPLDITTRESWSGTAAPFFVTTGWVCTLPLLSQAAARSGFLNAGPDSDGVSRRAPLIVGFNGRVYPSVAVAAVSVATADNDAGLRITNANQVLLTLGKRVVPLDGRSNLLVRFRGPRRTFPFLSAADILNDRAPSESIKDKMVFVGVTAVGSRNVVPTPFDGLFPGVEFQATVADNLLQEDFVYRPASGAALETIGVIAVGFSLALLVVVIGLRAGVVMGLVELVAVWLGSTSLLASNGMFLSPFYPTAVVAVTLLSLIIGKAGIERRRAELARRDVESAVLDR